MSSAVWKLTGHRFVAFIDIMGFKDMVARSTHDAIYKKLLKIAKYKAILNVEANACKFFLFSDSIILFSKGDSIGDWEDFHATVSAVYQSLLSDYIPFKGAIAHGEITVDSENSIFFGQPQIDAFLIADDLSLYGIVFHHTAEKFYKEKILKKGGGHDIGVMEYLLPFKTGIAVHKLFCPPAVFYQSHAIVNILDSYRDMTSGSLRKYIDNTEKFLLEAEKRSLVPKDPPKKNKKE